MGFLDREEKLIGKNRTNKLKESSVVLFGVGGVGGYVLEMLVRSGVEDITIVDFDTIDETNLNRQIITTTETIGQIKVEVAKKRAESINPNVRINALNLKFCNENISKIFISDFDYVIDCIDYIENKMELIIYCDKNKLNIISAMGAGNRYSVPNYIVSDINATRNDGLSRVVRKRCRRIGIKKLTVVSTQELAIKVEEGCNGSIAYHPASCGITMASYVINKLMGEN